MSRDVIAVSVLTGDDDRERCETLERQWAAWDPGVTLRILYTEYTSIVDPIVDFIDELRSSRHGQVVVLVPVIIPTRLRYGILHNHLDLVLSAALRRRADVVIARVAMALDETEGHEHP
jgi:hypothetical protein